MSRRCTPGAGALAGWWRGAAAACLTLTMSLAVGVGVTRPASAQAPAPGGTALPPAAPPATTTPPAATAPPATTAPPAADAPAPGAAPAQAGAEARPMSDLDPSKRFRFIERYVRDRDPSRATPGEISLYKVASRDVIRVSTERPQGAPARSERSVQIIYTERPAVVTSSGVVTDTVRRYEALRITPSDPAPSSAPPALTGLTVWYHKRIPGVGGDSHGPSMMSLDENRPITETEFAISQRQLFLPDVAGALPALPSRVGDRWRIPPGAAQALLGERPRGRTEPLSGTLTEVRKLPEGTDYVATVTVSGRAVLPEVGETLLNAQIEFVFPAPADLEKAATVDARGAIRQIRLARTSTGLAPGSSGRLRSTLTRELVLQRRQTSDVALLNAPEKPPEETQANSWLTYEDPKGRFHFRHPQELLPQRLPMFEQDDTVRLSDTQLGTDEGHIVTLTLQPKSGNPAEERNSRDPEFHLKELKANWARERQDVLPGPTGWLPDADWAPFNMRVYRIQAAVRSGDADGRDLQRIYSDYYLVLFTRNESLVVEAMTGEDPPTHFRQVVEAILKTYKLSPARGAGAGAGGATTAPARPPAATPAPAPAPATTPAPTPGTTTAPAPAPAPSPSPVPAPTLPRAPGF